MYVTLLHAMDDDWHQDFSGDLQGCPYSPSKKGQETLFLPLTLDGQNRQSPIASDFGSRTQIAALFAVLLYQIV